MRSRRRIVLVGGAGLVFVALVVLVRLVLEPEHRSAVRGEGRGEVTPLTDVAAKPRRFPPALESYDRGPSPGRPPPVALPPSRAPIPAGKPGGPSAGPGAPAPQWTEPLAVPGPPRPPDPFQEPEIAQDPNRGRPAADP